MNQEEFYNRYEIFYSEPKTIDSETVEVKFNQRQLLLKNKFTGEIEHTSIFVNAGSEELGEALLINQYYKI
jgi:hypothetical protein